MISIRRRAVQVFLFGAEAVFISLSLGACAMAFEIKSDAFQSEKNIPPAYTCDGEDVSPPLAWPNPPEGTKSFALIADDPDAPAGTWVHWVIYDLPAGAAALPAGLPKLQKLPDGSKQGITDFGRLGYGGPCPPPGKAHRYYFKLYALDTFLNLPPKQRKSDLLAAIEGHILAKTQLMGTYERK